MEEDPRVIFTLTALDFNARNIFQLDQNKKFLVPQPSRVAIEPLTRESTPATNVGDDDEAAATGGDGGDSGNNLQLVFRFDQKPKNQGQGFVFGSNRNTCDVIIGTAHDGISGSHFRITFDYQKRLVVRDSSNRGTAVSYNGQAKNQVRKNPWDRKSGRPRDISNDFQWILFPEWKNKCVEVEGCKRSDGTQHRVEFLVTNQTPKSEDCLNQYNNLRNAYISEMQAAVPFSLTLDSQLTTARETQDHSPQQRPKQRPIWINDEEIGNGTFGTVYRAVNVSTGVAYASKHFRSNKKDKREAWDREVALLRRLSHDHIVQFEDRDTEGEWPCLIMEYLPLGDLRQHADISVHEAMVVLCQGLDALTYLHSQRVVHRDLKPANILVSCREPGHFSIKVADFGLARGGSFLQTCCGTDLYAAPEIYTLEPYTSKVDIWSLGLIALEYVYSLPHLPMVNGQLHRARWYEILTDYLEDWDSDGLIDFLKSSMLVVEPRIRLEAAKCQIEAVKLFNALPGEEGRTGLSLGTPTERMSSSVFAENFGGKRRADTGTGHTSMRAMSRKCDPGSVPSSNQPRPATERSDQSLSPGYFQGASPDIGAQSRPQSCSEDVYVNRDRRASFVANLNASQPPANEPRKLKPCARRVSVHDNLTASEDEDRHKRSKRSRTKDSIDQDECRLSPATEICDDTKATCIMPPSLSARDPHSKENDVAATDPATQASLESHEHSVKLIAHGKVYSLQITRERSAEIVVPPSAQVKRQKRGEFRHIRTSQIEGNDVTIIDFEWINATQLLSVAKRDRYTKGFDWKDQHFRCIRVVNQTYVPPEVAVMICELVGLSALKDHFHQMSQTQAGDLKSWDTRLWLTYNVNGNKIRVFKDDKLVNLSDIFNAAGLSRSAQERLRKTIKSPVFKKQGGTFQGTYVKFDVAIDYCHRYGLENIEGVLIALKPATAEQASASISTPVDVCPALMEHQSSSIVDETHTPNVPGSRSTGTAPRSPHSGAVSPVAGSVTSSPILHQESRDFEKDAGQEVTERSWLSGDRCCSTTHEQVSSINEGPQLVQNHRASGSRLVEAGSSYNASTVTESASGSFGSQGLTYPSPLCLW